MMIKNEMISWQNAYSRNKSLTDITIYEKDEKYLVVATERTDNTGCSITNGAEQLWEQVIKDYNLKKEDCIFVETYYWSDQPQRWIEFLLIMEMLLGNLYQIFLSY